MDNKTFNINIIGASGVGKSAYMVRLVTGEFHNFAQKVNTLLFTTNYGNVTFVVTEGSMDSNTQGVIIFFALDDAKSFVKATELVAISHVPSVLCGNKVDLKDTAVSNQDICIFRETVPALETYSVSAKNCYNFEKPFLSLARQLTRNPNLQFINNEF